MPITPIFVFSITRSGSTLVQRIIAAHEGVATVSEPWLLLPNLYSLRAGGVVAEYTHPLLVSAMEDFCSELPGGIEDYRAELREFILRLYARAAGEDARFFLDKSPPYYLVAQEIIDLFPDARFVFLWRNPLSVLASIIETWQGGRWHPTAFREDLFIGVPRLVEAYEANAERAYAVRYEDLVGGETEPWRALMAHLGIDFEPASLERFAGVALSGRMGDPVGVERYSRLSAEPTQKWTGTIHNPLRRAWCARYLRFLGAERLAVMGYEQQFLLDELHARPLQLAAVIGDAGRLVADVAKEPLRARARRHGIGGPGVLRELIGA